MRSLSKFSAAIATLALLLPAAAAAQTQRIDKVVILSSAEDALQVTGVAMLPQIVLTPGSQPATATEGKLYWSSSLHTLIAYNGSTWAGLGAVTSVTGTSNQVTCSPTIGAVVCGTPQNIHTAATPTFASLNLSASSNQIVLQSGGVTGTLTWTPSSSNKVITFPDITGTVVTTGDTGSVTNTMLAGSIANAKLANSSVTISGHSLSLGGSLSLVASDVSLGNVTNDAQTKAAIVPNTAPSSGQILVGSAGGTAYAPQTLSGSGATFSLSSAGVLTVSGIANASLSNSSVTYNGKTVALGGSATLTLASSDFANQGTTTTVLHGAASGNPSFAAVVSADLNITTTTCTNQFIRSLSAGAVGTCATVANADLANSSITIAGTSTALGGSITLDTITGLGSTGLVKRTGSNALAIATADSDYLVTKANLAGTSNQVNLSASGTGVLVGSTNITLSTPQDIHTAATPQFARLGLGAAADATALIYGLKAGIGATSTDGFVLINTTDAAVGAQQWAARMRWTGRGWKTAAGGASQIVDVIAELQPTQGVSTPGASLIFSTQLNAGGYTKIAAFTNGTDVAGSGANDDRAYLALKAGSAGAGSLGPIAGTDHINITRGGSSGIVVAFGNWTANAEQGAFGNGLSGFSNGAQYTSTASTVATAFGTGDASGSNIAGGNTTVYGGRSTGTGGGGSILLRTTPAAGGSSSSANSLVTAVTIDSTGTALFTGGTTNTESVNVKAATTTVTCNGGGGTCTASNLVPAGAFVISVTARVTTILAGAGLTTWSLGDGSTADLWATGKALAAGTTVNATDHKSTWNPKFFNAANNVVLTAAAGVFSSGVVRITVFYLDSTAPAS